MKKSKNKEFIKHTGNNCPVPPSTLVSYRTINDEVSLSHEHYPVYAGDIDWSDRPQVGRIFDYRRVGALND